MENISVLPRIYRDITGENIDISDFDNRIIMQKFVFLLGELGVSVGNYTFVWDKYGPFSQSLKNDISLIDTNDIYNEQFMDTAKNAINFIKDIFNKNDTKYSKREWIENIASCVFMKKYLYPLNSWDDITNKIKRLKPYLSDNKANQQCSCIANTIVNY